MKIEDLYNQAVQIGISRDQRGVKEIKRLLKEEKDKFDKLEKSDRDFFDKDRLFNPFSDSRILFGGPETDIKTVMVGIDIGTAELLLARSLSSTQKPVIDAVISHHPEGHALAQLFDVMRLQSDLLAQYGVTLSVAEQLLEIRIGEIERRLLPVNHSRAVDAARLLNIPFLCLHTPADNCVTQYLKILFEKNPPQKIRDLIRILKGIPEYRLQSIGQAPPKIVSGSENSGCGKIYVDMTGGTSGSKDSLGKLSAAGVSTIVGMHMSEEYLEAAKKAHLNVVIAGHISSDNLGLNLLFDEIEKNHPLQFIEASGFRRIRR